MSRKSYFAFIFNSMILLLLVSCIPAQVIPTQQQPVSTSNPNVFSTMVASTAGAFMTQTMEAMPTATATLPPPLETSTPTVTPTPTDSNEKTSLTEMEDDSIQFFDYRAGVKLTIPAGWLAIRLGEQETLDAWEAAENDSVLKHGLEAVQGLDHAVYRLLAFNTGDEYTFDGEGSSIAIQFFENDTRMLGEVVVDEVQPKPFEEYEFISSEYQVRADRLELFALEENWQVTSSTEQAVTLYHKRVIFKVSSGTVSIELFVPSEIKDDVLPEFDQMIEQLSVFTP